MTELALSGLAMPLLGGFTNPPRNTRNEEANTEAAEKRESPREAERVVSGEVLSASENTYSYLNNAQTRSGQNQSTNNSDTPNTAGQTRRFSLQAALQTFAENEAIVVDQNRAVQVSGIIDEYV
jgi:hypothetical protein